MSLRTLLGKGATSTETSALSPHGRHDEFITSDDLSPADRFAELFIAVQKERVFEDSKTFVDCSPKHDPVVILETYRTQFGDAGFDLAAFVDTHFDRQPMIAEGHRSEQGQPLSEHIDVLWDMLSRCPQKHPPRGSLLPLPYDYLVPGGRFAELYYWDSYFTMLGLTQPAHHALLECMTDNFAHLVDTFGHVPNGTRTYYLSRSQPPVFALMVELLESCTSVDVGRYLPQLMREHAFWMDGAETLSPGQSHRRVVSLEGGHLLNRYWDDRDTPREESWREDVATAARSERPAAEVHRDLRAACESGWDFSTRWLAEEPDVARADLSTIRTTDILPVDLNAFLHRLETTIGRLARLRGFDKLAQTFESWASRRHLGIDALLWDADRSAYFDYDWRRTRSRLHLNAATVTPLYTRTASAGQASLVAQAVERELLAPGGMATTARRSDQQWDDPNGWAPLQWLAIRGLQHYGHKELASKIRERWLHTVDAVFAKEGRLVEKYSLASLSPGDMPHGGGGEYELQEGFGWTNGITQRLLRERPD